MKLCVITGEASGDLHAADVVKELRRALPDLEVFGIGGQHLERQSVRIIQPIDHMAVFGLFNVIRHLPMFRRIFRQLLEQLRTERPDAVLLVDFPDFNLRVAKECRNLGIPVIYFISPQLWAWRKRRIQEIRRNVDLMLVIFPFEERFYRERGIEAHYVGHPLVEQLEGIRRVAPPLDPTRPVRMLLLPGSRRSEVDSLLRPMVDVIDELRRERPVDATILRAPTIGEDRLRRLLGGRTDIAVRDSTKERLADADLALAASGTVTLECAIVGLPVVVLYRLSPLTYHLGRRLVRIPYFSLVNIVAGKGLVPELLQDQVNGPAVAAEVRRLLEPKAYEKVSSGLAEVRRELGEGGAGRQAAEKIATLLRERAVKRSHTSRQG